MTYCADIYANIIEGAAEKAGTEMIPREWGEAVPMLDEMMTRGELGVKTGKGFFEVCRSACFSVRLIWI